MIKEDVLTGVKRGAGHREGELRSGEKHLLQKSALADRKIVEAVNPDMLTGKPVLFGGTLQGEGQLVQRVVKALFHQRSKRLIDKGHISQLFAQSADGLLCQLRHPLWRDPGTLEIRHSLQHIAQKADITCLTTVNTELFLYLINGFPHQKGTADLIKGAAGQTAALPKDIFRKPREAEQCDILLFLAGKQGADTALHLKGGMLRHQQQDALLPCGGFSYLAQHLGGFSGTGFA